jgi:hypothetical protein
MNTLRKIVILLVLYLITKVSYAQTWDRIGNLTLATDFLGTTNSQPMKIFTNNSEKLRILTTGQVGIGTTNPLAMLHVNANSVGVQFRTDGPNGFNNSWQFFTAGTEKFRAYVPSASTSIFMNATATDGTFQLQTGGTSRMIIQKSSTTTAYGVNTAGFITIGNSIPTSGIPSPLHIQASQPANPQGWNRALTLSNNASLYFDGGTNASLFLAHPSTNPLGNFYCGSASDLTSIATVDYAYSIHTTTVPAGSPLNSTTFFKNLFVTAGPAANVTALNERRLGVNTNTPQNIIEINTSNTSPIPGRSGLRFTDLTSSSLLTLNPGQGVLTVDANGDVIYVNTNTVTTGNYCSAPQNNLTGDFEVPLTGNYNYYFSGANTSSVGIGWACNSSLKAKIDVIDDTKGIAGDFNTYGTTFGTGQAVMAHAYASGIGNIGVQGYATSSSGPFNYGILGYANGATINRAGYFSGDLEYTGAFISSDQQLKTNIEDIPSALSIVKSLDAHSYFMDTLNFNQFSFDSKKQYGFIAQELEIVLPELVHNSYNPGIKDSTGTYIAQPLSYKSVNYNAIIPINTQAIKELDVKIERQTLSDQSIKSNVNNLTGSLNKVLAMRGVSFNWNQNLVPQYELDNTEHIGFIAQEINAIDSRLTFISDENLMHVDYNKIVPIAVEAIQELNNQIAQRDSVINSLNDRLTQLESCLSGILPFLCQISHNSIQPTQQEFQQQLKKEIDVQLSNKGTIILNQNVPNPFAEQTQISFSIPETVKKAQIHFYDANGKLINSVEVQERGLGQLNVFANDLSTGMYTYTLVADGQIVATKKMMKQ